MLELITETDNEYTIIYNIHDLFIYGVSARKDKLSAGRQIAIKSLNQIKEQFKEVISWTEAEEDWFFTYDIQIRLVYNSDIGPMQAANVGLEASISLLISRYTKTHYL